MYDRTLVRLYKVYVRSVFEYGSICFLHCPDTTLSVLQKLQNRAIRNCLRLPRYVSLKLLHESSGLATIKERFHQLGSGMLAKMRRSNPLIREIAERREAQNLHAVIQGQFTINRPHRSPLDILLPVQRPFLTST